jgi:hypothetical protein
MEENVERLGPALLKAFMKVPDPRSPSGKRHPLPAILTLATGAMLCNCHSLYAIFQWGRGHEELALKLGFKGGKTPAVTDLVPCLGTPDDYLTSCGQSWCPNCGTFFWQEVRRISASPRCSS